MGVRRLLGWIAGLGLAGAASAQQMQIQFAEPVNITASAGATQFDAYGRRFDLQLVGNDRLVSGMSAARKREIAGVRLMRGRLAGIAHSWVRLTFFSGRTEGVIWDGRDLYVITSYERIEANLTTPLAAAPKQAVVYRLSDTLNALPRQFCALDEAGGLPSNNGLAQYRKLQSEIAVSQALSLPLTRQIEISLIADSAFQAQLPIDTTAEMLARFNVAEGIFGEQAGLLLLATDVRIEAGTPDPFPSTHASTLLDQLRDFRQLTPAVAQRGIAHLITGKDLDGDTAGIAILGQACTIDHGISLSEGWLGVAMGGLVMAHELGHNFGAEHDGSGACSAEPLVYLMSPFVNGSAQLSQCSLTSMRTHIDTRSCFLPADYAHVELAPAAPPIETEVDNPVVLDYVVRSTGTRAATDVQLQVLPHGTMPVTAVSPAAGCAIGNGNLVCSLGDLAAGEVRALQVTVVPSALGSYPVEASVTASNNQHGRDSSQVQAISVLHNSDGAISMSAASAGGLTGEFVDFDIDVHSLRSHDLLDARVSLSAGGLELVSVTGNASCTFGGNTAVCQLGQIATGATRHFTVRARITAVGTLQLNANLFASNDTLTSNNFASANVRGDPRRDVGVEAVSPEQVGAFGEGYEITANIRAFGVEPIDNVTFTLSIQRPSGFGSIDSLTIGGVPCTTVSFATYVCAVGTLAPGEVRPVVVRAQGNELGYHGYFFRTSAPQQDDNRNDEVSRAVIIRHAVDVAAGSGSSQGPDHRQFDGHFWVESTGIDAIAASEVTLALPPQVSILSYSVLNGIGGCSIVDAQHLRCTFALNRYGERAVVSWIGIADQPGEYEGTVTAVTQGDGNSGNDLASTPIRITSLVDVGIQPLAVPPFLVVGRNYNIPVNVTVGTQPVNSAWVRLVLPIGVDMVAVSTPSGSCVRTAPSSFECQLGQLAGGSIVSLIATISAPAEFQLGNLFVNAETPGDNDSSNNLRSAFFASIGSGDLQVSVASGAVAAHTGTNFAYPRITLRRLGPMLNGRVEISLPAFVTVVSVSSNAGICSGTTLLQCELPVTWAAIDPLIIDLSLSATGTGSFASTVRVRAENDIDASNDEAGVAMSVTHPAPPSGGSSSGGGSSGGAGKKGGGALEWLSLGVLGLALYRRRKPLH